MCTSVIQARELGFDRMDRLMVDAPIPAPALSGAWRRQGSAAHQQAREAALQKTRKATYGEPHGPDSSATEWRRQAGSNPGKAEKPP
ncbi:hypothetical protein GGTG_09549 [Gaeumannomyces tritici R3-111a-1]|uniref:Uncharacterized protein n=1 Tax=Gaeumannomyces tritici (strain R3-111a-1) TaxID=644352 RepID=J3P7Q7_GAET3|nr:hypothetical protein GGTG_09549 [Gaeumannomyces tritici R3-111a-1]EJT72690.1 hypothetical protein GGTG_09549 [Gaeumannomyces tritici R3-111a-1]